MVPIIGLSMLEAAKAESTSWMHPIAAPFGHYAGLVWPMLIAAICAVVCFLKMPETYKVDISSDASVASIGTGKVTSGD